MKRFLFKLGKILKVREYEQKLAESRLTEANGRCILIERELEQNAVKTLGMTKERFTAGRPMAEIRAFELYGRRLEQERERIMRRLAEAEAAKEAARVAWIEKSKRKEILEKLSEREESAYYALARVEEVKTLDDMAQNARSVREREIAVRTA